MSRSYSDSTPGVTFSYDSANGNGHLWSVSNANSVTNYSVFDALGRVTAGSQVTGGQACETYPSGRVVTTYLTRFMAAY